MRVWQEGQSLVGVWQDGRSLVSVRQEGWSLGLKPLWRTSKCPQTPPGSPKTEGTVDAEFVSGHSSPLEEILANSLFPLLYILP